MVGAPPQRLTEFANELLSGGRDELFPYDSTRQLTKIHQHYLSQPGEEHISSGCSGLQDEKDLKKSLKLSSLEYAALPCGHHLDLNIGACREVSFHWGETFSEDNLYLVWVLGTSWPLNFHIGDEIHAANIGDLFVFDAQCMHALLNRGATEFSNYEKNDYSKKMVFGLGIVKMGKNLRDKMGIKTMRTPSSWKSGMKKVNFSDITGKIIN